MNALVQLPIGVLIGSIIPWLGARAVTDPGFVIPY